jgi:hypothetical protein
MWWGRGEERTCNTEDAEGRERWMVGDRFAIARRDTVAMCPPRDGGRYKSNAGRDERSGGPYTGKMMRKD